MNYKEKYNEALEKASKLRVQNPFDTVGQMVEHIFPELKESEDERIKREILELVSISCNGNQFEEIKDWLENQGEKDPCIGCTNDKGCVTCVDGSMKETKVKPKFNDGEWIIRSAEEFKHNTYLIKEIKDYYVCEDLKGRRVTFTFNDVHKNFKLWDISDAKDGDVLAIDWHEGDDSWEKIIIFKKYHNKGVKGVYNSPCVEGYGNTFKNGKIALQEETPYYSKTWTDNLHPATKEQRDTLIKAMANAGLYFDFEKKEFKKVEVEKLDADKVIKWLNDQACQGWIEDVEVDKFVDKFKEDFGL